MTTFLLRITNLSQNLNKTLSHAVLNKVCSATLAVLIVIYFWLLPLSRPANAFVAFNDQFVAQTACPAPPKIQGAMNPGNVTLAVKQVYEVIGKNKPDATHYLIKIPSANPVNRWVPVSCGTLTGSQRPVASGQENLLALSWQPSFCETKPDKDECKSQTPRRFDAKNLVLHGLWPQGKSYCGVDARTKQLDMDKKWSSLPPITLSVSTKNALSEKMPGFASDLHLHEWYKHGTCYSSSPEEYYQESMALLDQVNNSTVQDLFESNISQFLAASAIRSTFDQSFGRGAGDRVQVSCAKDINQNNDNMIIELWLNLKGDIQPNTAIKDLLSAGRTVEAGCARGEVDPAGVDQ
jgi:ribonuclease T2